MISYLHRLGLKYDFAFLLLISILIYVVMYQIINTNVLLLANEKDPDMLSVVAGAYSATKTNQTTTTYRYNKPARNCD